MGGDGPVAPRFRSGGRSGPGKSPCSTSVSVIAIVAGLYTARPRPFESSGARAELACLCALSSTHVER